MWHLSLNQKWLWYQSSGWLLSVCRSFSRASFGPQHTLSEGEMRRIFASADMDGSLSRSAARVGLHEVKLSRSFRMLLSACSQEWLHYV